HCHKQPKYNDGTIIHPYCGKSCVQKAAAARVTQTPSRPRKDGCLLCGTSIKRGVFCSQACASKAENQAPLLLEVPNGHDKFQSVADQFKTSWRCQTPCPTVRRVYKVVCSRSSTNMYETYRDQVEARGNFVASGRSPGNENRRWHGTKRQCLLGDNGNTTLCSSSSCSLCGIIRNSYSLKLCRQPALLCSFGAGIYTSSTSSKSNGYSSNGTHSNLKAILLNKVVVGRGHKMTYSGLGLTAPPSGYDSKIS
ncbi:hypothetical protein ID866_8086, partial [Astraeus odoratus]